MTGGSDKKRLRPPLKVLVVLSDGGHTAQMVRLLELLGPVYDYQYMMAVDDRISEGKIPWKGCVYRVRIPLGKYKRNRGIWRVLRSIWDQTVVYLRVRPGAILSNGSSIAIPVSVLGRVFGAKIIHVETRARVYTMSSTGKFMYHIAHLFFVQWEPLHKKYPRSLYAGRLS